MTAVVDRRRETRARRRESNLCIGCGRRPPRSHRDSCEVCAAGWAVRDGRRRAERFCAAPGHLDWVPCAAVRRCAACGDTICADHLADHACLPQPLRKPPGETPGPNARGTERYAARERTAARNRYRESHGIPLDAPVRRGRRRSGSQETGPSWQCSRCTQPHAPGSCLCHDHLRTMEELARGR